jgi:HD-GYP domain-containing protein (c-di-GMP phosphodiesterase class II)
MIQTIDISALLPGMFVVNVTKQIGDVTITASGKVKDADYIANMVNKGILEVEVDLNKSTHKVEQAGQVTDEDYSNASGLTYNQQLELSLKLHDQAKSIQARIIKRSAKGKLNHLEEANEITEQLVDAAFKCEDALSITTLLNEDAEYFLEHSINCALLMVLFGQSLKLDESVLHKLGVGALLMDIGMMRLPLLLTQKNTSLTPQEETKMQSHVDIALKLIEPLDSIDEISMQVVKHHHERLDGSGYPDGLRDNQISMYGKMAAIVDTYDSMTTARPYREAFPPATALKKLSNETLGLDKELVSQFILCIGAYPIGSVVKLNSGKLAMVIRLNKLKPLAPVVMVFYDIHTKKETPSRIDLSVTDEEIIDSVSLDQTDMSMSQLLSKALTS